MNNNTYVAIMAGGIGSRFWPVSRSSYPKQFIDILGSGKSLIQQTVERFLKLVPADHIFVVTAAEYSAVTREQLAMLPEENIVLEPCRKNTAACVAYISTKVSLLNPEAAMIVAPADHLILMEDVFLSVCRQALSAACTSHALVTIGIQPSYANTGYGYIQREADALDAGIYRVKNFFEKPSREKAEAYLASGEFLWNSGIFIWQVSDILEAFKMFMPEMYQLFADVSEKINTGDEQKAIEQVYALCLSVSVDVAIIEKAKNILVIPAAFGWSDLGTWNAAWECMGKDQHDNSVAGDRVMIVDSSKCVVRAPENKVVVVEGLEDYIVVDTKDVLLICKKKHEQEIKRYASEVKELHGEAYA